MAFKLSPEQLELKNSIRRLLQNTVTSEYLRKRMSSNTPSDPEVWNSLIELGVFAYFSSTDEDLKPTFKDLSILSEECGRALLPEALVNCLFSGVYLINQVAEKQAAEKSLLFEDVKKQKLEEGERLTCYASVVTNDLKVKKVKGSTIVSGSLRFVAGAAECRFVSFVSDNDFFVLDLTTSKNVLIEKESTLDESLKRYKVSLSNAECSKLEAIETPVFQNLDSILQAAEISGACSKMLELTNRFVKEREQFGVPVGSFQAVQHKLSDMFLKVEALSALVDFAAWAADESRDQLDLSAMAAINYARQVGPEIAEVAIQLHGGMGFTWEADLHLYLRRIQTLVALNDPGDGAYKKVLELAQD